MAVQPRVITVRRRERLFYIGMAVAILVTVFAGFSRSYFLKAQFGTPSLSLLLHVHGLVFTSWILLFLAQTTLVAARRTDIRHFLVWPTSSLWRVWSTISQSGNASIPRPCGAGCSSWHRSRSG
jgi:hypothetical protein